MARPMFTPEELAELAAADAQIDETFIQTQEERVLSRKRDRAAVVANMDPERRKIAESQRAYREANKDKIAESKRAYYEANKDKIAESQRAWQKRNREKRNAYQREYRARKKESKCAVSV